LQQALDRIGGQYEAVDAEPVGSLVDLSSIGATRFDDGWYAIADAPDGARIAFTSDDGLDWQQLPGEISGLPDDVRGPYQLWALGDDIVLRGRIVDDSASQWAELDLMVGRSEDGLSWHTFPGQLSAPGSVPDLRREVARTTTGSLFAYSSPYFSDRLFISPTVYVLDADAPASEAPKAIDAPPGLAITALHGDSTGIFVNLQGFRIGRLSSTSVGRITSDAIEPVPGVPLSRIQVVEIVRGVMIDGFNRASSDGGTTWTAYDLDRPPGSTYSPFGALASHGGRYQAQEDFVSKDGLLWEEIWLPNSLMRVLDFNEDGVLIILFPYTIDPSPNGFSLFARIPWPETGVGDFNVEEQQALVLERNQPLIDHDVVVLTAWLHPDDGPEYRESFNCVSRRASTDSIQSILTAASECEIDALDRLKETLSQDVRAAGFANTPSGECAIGALDAYSAEEFASDAAQAFNAKDLFFGLVEDLVSACDDAILLDQLWLDPAPIPAEILGEIESFLELTPEPLPGTRECVVETLHEIGVEETLVALLRCDPIGFRMAHVEAFGFFDHEDLPQITLDCLEAAVFDLTDAEIEEAAFAADGDQGQAAENIADLFSALCVAETFAGPAQGPLAPDVTQTIYALTPLQQWAVLGPVTQEVVDVRAFEHSDGTLIAIVSSTETERVLSMEFASETPRTLAILESVLATHFQANLPSDGLPTGIGNIPLGDGSYHLCHDDQGERVSYLIINLGVDEDCPV